MDTVQLLFRTRAAKKDEDLLDKVQSYLAAAVELCQTVESCLTTYGALAGGSPLSLFQVT